MKKQEMRSIKLSYEQPQAESIRLHVEAVICQSGGGAPDIFEDPSKPNP
jgi:hypothetical protein